MSHGMESNPNLLIFFSLYNFLNNSLFSLFFSFFFFLFLNFNKYQFSIFSLYFFVISFLLIDIKNHNYFFPFVDTQNKNFYTQESLFLTSFCWDKNLFCLKDAQDSPTEKNFQEKRNLRK
jgi:hypothetical protein